MNSTFLDLRSFKDDFYYMLIDPRYCRYVSNREVVEIRLAITYGPNITIEMAGQILAPSVQNGDYCYGLHIVEVKDNNMVRIVDLWLDSYPAIGGEKLEDIIQRSNELLEEISNEGYAKLCTSDTEDAVTVKIRPIENPLFKGYM